ncbi:kinase-like domain-containing protein [Thelonectria olida]|uniref:ethanolamine kinase n=1 Tax=Thelonectria olida TaxID=1576542 RepID=A0A9P9AKF5_9HYPO|nr:kinase-like domain-containing protein [Thelonectria olida]
MAADIPFVQHVFDTADAEASALELAPFLFRTGQPSEGQIRVKTLTEGTTNALFKVSDEKTGPQSQPENVLIKVYGEGTEITIDRNKEIKLHSILAKHNLAPSLLLRFANGHAYQFLEGTACSVEDLANERIWRGVAREFANWHAVLPTVDLGVPDRIVDFEPSIWSTARKWLNALPTETEKQRTKKGLLHDEFQHLVREMLGNGPRDPMVLGHGDLLSGNIILQEEVNSSNGIAAAKFIDYEHSTYCPRAFELANHFAEWTGFECDYNLLPTTSTRLAFIREYLQAHHDIIRERDGSTGSLPSRVTQAEVDRVMAEVDAFRGFPGFYWGLCALIQAQASTGSIDFDYAGYADKRLLEYWAWRGKSKQGANGAASLREERWAAP